VSVKTTSLEAVEGVLRGFFINRHTKLLMQLKKRNTRQNKAK